MCTIYFAYKAHSKYPLILLANRDEAYARESMGMHRWPGTNVFSGRDLREGGMWTAVDTKGRLGVVTNYRDLNAYDPNRLSRGHLIRYYLEEFYDFKSRLTRHALEYNPFNLLFGRFDDLNYFSNITRTFVKVDPGIHGLSNHLLDTPWIKVQEGKRQLETLINSAEDIEPAALFEILDNRNKSWEALPEGTGLSPDEEYHLSSTFIEGKNYGTQFQTLILVGADRNVQIHEKKKTQNTWLSKTIIFSLEE